jgi:hypothetical protein
MTLFVAGLIFIDAPPLLRLITLTSKFNVGLEVVVCKAFDARKLFSL